MSPAKTITILTLAALIGCARIATVKPEPAAITASADPADTEVMAAVETLRGLAAEETEWRQSPLFERVLEGPFDTILYLAPSERIALVAGAIYATTPTAP